VKEHSSWIVDTYVSTNLKEQVELPKEVAEVVYRVLGEHDNESIQEVDWRELSQTIADKVLDLLQLKGLIP
jgi:hypothetical protein